MFPLLFSPDFMDIKHAAVVTFEHMNIEKYFPQNVLLSIGTIPYFEFYYAVSPRTFF